MLPTHERLDSDHLTGTEDDERLVMKSQLLVLDGAPEVRFAEQLLGRARAVPVAAERDADAGTDGDNLIPELKWSLERSHHPLGDIRRLGLVVDPVEEHREFVPTQTGRRVNRAQAPGEARPHLLQQLVAGDV